MRAARYSSVLLLVLLPHPAQADLKLCNRTSYVLEAATSTIKNTDSLTQGWTPHHSRRLRRRHQGPAEPPATWSMPAPRWPMPGRERAWGGAFPVCVKDGDFILHQAVTQPYCTAPDTFALPFAPVNFKNRRDWTMDFDETPALPSLTAAQLAGVKRLLSDNGYKVGAIDGKPSKPTGAALADFRRQDEVQTRRRQ